MRTHAITLWLATTCFVSHIDTVSAQASPRAPRLSTLDQLTRLQIPVTSGSSFRMLSGKKGELTLVVDRVTADELAPLASLSDSRVRKVGVRALGLDRAEIEVTFHDASTESFAYQQGDNLVVDLWKGAAPTQAAAPSQPHISLPKQVKGGKPTRAPASGHAAAHSSETAKTASKAITKATVEPLRIERDLFQKFLLPMPALEITAKDKGLTLPLQFEIESRWNFAKGNKETDDGKAFEFAKKLFETKKYGLCLKAIEILLRDHPKTPHESELLFLRALAYKKLGEVNKADFLGTRAAKMFEELAARRNEHGEPYAFTRLIVLDMAQKQLAAQNWLAAIQHLEYVSSHTDHKDAEYPYVQMLLAECYGKVNEPRRAERIYRFLTEKFAKHQLAKEAYYRIASLLASEKNYQRVTEEGQAAIAAYPEYERTRSEVLFHVGEAYFWLGNYDKAEKFFRRYTTIAPSQTNSSLAWVRLGEIDEVHRSSTKAAREKYFKAKNGYPFSRGDLVATVRLARIELPFEKEPDFVVRTLKEMLGDKTVDWDLKRMAELTLADYMLITGETTQAIAIANAGMAQTDGAAYELYKRAYQKGLFAQLSKFSKEKRYAEALALYDREKKWLEEFGAETLRVAAEVYRGLGLYATSNKLMERYGNELLKSRVPASFAAAGQLSREKAGNSFARGAYLDTLGELKGAQDSKSTYQRAISHFRMRQPAQAYSAASRLLPMLQADKRGFTDDMIENIAEILIEHSSSERDYPRMERDVAACRALLEKESERLAYAAADAFWYQKRHKEAANGYREALEKFPTGIRAERGKYNLGISLVGLGKRDDAVKLLTDLRDSGQSVWAESAKQEVQLIEWERKYSSVLRTLPPGGLGITQ